MYSHACESKNYLFLFLVVNAKNNNYYLFSFESVNQKRNKIIKKISKSLDER